MPSPSPSPLPVVLVNDPSWLDITTQIVIPVLSLLVAAAAILHAHTSQHRREAKEDVQRSRTARDAFAPQLRNFGRNYRAGRPAAGAQFIDEWNEVMAGAPDVASRKIAGWAMLQYGMLDLAFARRPDQVATREHARLLLQTDFETRVRAWQVSGEVNLSPHHGEDEWPAAPLLDGNVADEGAEETH